MNHQFDVDHAILFGLQEAIFINNFQFWLRQNAANERNIRNDKPWTYNTHKAYCKQFPYMSENQIRRVLESLVTQGILEKAKFNDNKYDHTLWYSFTDEFLLQNPLFDLANLPDRTGQEPASHTDKKTDKKTDTNNNIAKRSSSKKSEAQKPESVSNQVWEDWKHLRKTRKAPITQTAIDGIAREAAKAGFTLEQALEICCCSGWQGFKADWVNKSGSQGFAKQPGASMKSFAQQERERGWMDWEEMTNEIHPEMEKIRQQERAANGNFVNADVIDVTPQQYRIGG